MPSRSSTITSSLLVFWPSAWSCNLERSLRHCGFWHHFFLPWPAGNPSACWHANSAHHVHNANRDAGRFRGRLRTSRPTISRCLPCRRP